MDERRVLRTLFRLLSVSVALTVSLVLFQREKTSDAPLSVTLSATINPERLVRQPPNIVLLQQPPVRLLQDVNGNRPDSDALTIRLGTLLLEDWTGKKVQHIKSSFQSEYGRIREITRQWLEGKGKTPITWNTLIGVLDLMQLRELTTAMRTSICKEVLNVPAFPYSYSEPIIDAAHVLKEWYKHLPVVEFGRLVSGDIHLNVTMKDKPTNITITTKELLHELESGMLRRLVITGQPGTGKRTLMRYLAKEWSEGRTLQLCQITFLLHLGDFKSTGYHSLNDLLAASPNDLRDSRRHIAEEITARQGAGACFLLDGYDEWYEKDYVYKLMFQDSLYHSLCKLTSRSELNFMGGIGIKHVVIVGVDNKDLETYLKLHSAKKINSVLNMWKVHPTMREVYTLPLHLSMIVTIAKHMHDRIQTIQTRTQLYSAFIEQTILHNGFPNRHNSTVLQLLHHVAFQMIFGDKSTSSDQPEVEIQGNIQKLDFVDVSVVTTRTPNQVKYTFTHPTFLEYFAALHLTTLPLEKQLDYITLYGNVFHDVWLFYFGLLGDKYILNAAEISLLLKHSSSYYTHKVEPNTASVCDFEIKTQFLELVQEVNWNGTLLSDLLHSAEVVANSTLCVEYIAHTNNFIKYTLQSAIIQTFKFHTIVDGIHYSITLQNHSQALSNEYLELMSCLHNNDTTCTTFPSVVSFNISTKSKNMDLIKAFINLNSLYVNVDWVPFSDSRWNISVLPRILNTNCLKRIKVSMPCRHLATLSVINEGRFANIQYFHLELANCYFSYAETMLQVNMREYSLFNVSINTLQALTVVAPERDIDVLVLLNGLMRLQQLHLIKVSISEANIDHFLEILSQNNNLLILEISHAELGNSGLRRLCSHLPHSLQELILSDSNITDDQVCVLSEALKNLTTLKLLGLPYNHITDKGLILLAEGLKSNNNLHSLDLLMNKIYGEEIEVLSQLTNLHHLDIRGCHLSPTLIHSLTKIFLHLTELRSLKFCISIQRKGRNGYSETDDEYHCENNYFEVPSTAKWSLSDTVDLFKRTRHLTYLRNIVYSCP